MLNCPCGLNRDELTKNNLVDHNNQKCKALYYSNGNEVVCGMLFTAHPPSSVLKQPSQVPDSPRKYSSVWILAIQIVETEVIKYEPIGTAFAVTCGSMNKLLSADHNFCEKREYDNGKGRIVSNYQYIKDAKFVIFKSITRIKSGGTTTEEVSSPIIPVKRICGEKQYDWAIIQRTDRKQFLEEDTIAICPISELPLIENEPSAKIYHCAVSSYNNFDNSLTDLLSPEVSINIKITKRTEHYFNLCHGLSSGSSGGAVIDRRGLAIGIHLESWSPIRVTTLHREMTQDERDEAINGSVSSIADSYSSYIVCVIPSTIPRLMENL